MVVFIHIHLAQCSPCSVVMKMMSTTTAFNSSNNDDNDDCYDNDDDDDNNRHLWLHVRIRTIHFIQLNIFLNPYTRIYIQTSHFKSFECLRAFKLIQIEHSDWILHQKLIFNLITCGNGQQCKQKQMNDDIQLHCVFVEISFIV